MKELEKENRDCLAASLKHYRALNKFSQQQVADAVGISKNAYLRAEQGKSDPRSDWLLKACKLYGISLARLFESLEVPEVAFLTNRHSTKHAQAAQLEAIRTVVAWARDYQWLESVLEETPYALPDVAGMSPQEAAETARKTLWERGGFTPESFPGTLARFGIRVYIGDLRDRETFGFAYHDAEAGWVIAVNNYLIPCEQQLWNAAHELGHILLGTAGKAHEKHSKAEMDAQRFASMLLMPEVAFRRRWEDSACQFSFFNRVVSVKHVFHVPAAAVVRRVAELESVRDKMPLQEIYGRMIAHFNAEAKRQKETVGRGHEPRTLCFPFGSDAFRSLALRAYRREEITLSRLAELYGFSPAEMRRRLHEADAENLYA